jgi:hypothetical protein
MISTLPIYAEVLLLVLVSALATLFIGGLFAKNPDCDDKDSVDNRKE